MPDPEIDFKLSHSVIPLSPVPHLHSSRNPCPFLCSLLHQHLCCQSSETGNVMGTCNRIPQPSLLTHLPCTCCPATSLLSHPSFCAMLCTQHCPFPAHPLLHITHPPCLCNTDLLYHLLFIICLLSRLIFSNIYPLFSFLGLIKTELKV